MDETRQMSTVVKGLRTTSDKIRALLRAGYLRADVARFLNIRYQHVRKVAVDSGLEQGLQRGIKLVPAKKAVQPDSEKMAIDVLVDAGFALLGSWLVTDDGIGLSTPAPKDPGVYVFVVDGKIKYVGLTKMGLHRRMYNYRKPGATQRTSRRIHQIILKQVGSGTVVDIYIAVPPMLEWNGLPIHTAAGLEAGLIDMLKPPWNMMGVRASKAP